MTLHEGDLLELDDGSMALELKAAELEVTVDELLHMMGLSL
tara:strand:+ start:547 stop:669 length:123 start_codon:yes stop_codon:yes gene_type:complete